ncbi:MAG: DEAD/DEAH box helicase [Bacillota bacterium]
MLTFKEFPISSSLLKAIEEMGFETPTPIQQQTIPIALEGKDLIGKAQTGTGKTAAFAIPVLEKIEITLNRIQAMVLTPTRELAIQVSEEINRIGKHKNIRSLPIYGGQDITRQFRALRSNPQVIVATPGRLLDHMERRTIQLHHIHLVVLDEADEMLNMGFLEDVEKILESCPKERQTFMFSATIKREILNLANKFMINPEIIEIKPHEVTLPEIRQVYYEVPEKLKLDVLCRVLDIQNPDLALVFGRTKRRVDELTDALQKRGYLAEGIHGDMSQKQRETVMSKFRNGSIEILVATDVAARGLDITGVTHVYNFDIPQDVDSYVHRIGRTGRAGRSGVAATFVEPRERGHLRTIEYAIRTRLNRQSIPTFQEAQKEKIRWAVTRISRTLEEGRFQEFQNAAEQMLNDYDSVTLLAAALKTIAGEQPDLDIKLTEEPPLRSRKGFKQHHPGSFQRRGHGKYR